MTPMIDIVFQLLVFFIMTFKIVAMEGDFNITMPQATPSSAPPEDVIPPLKLRLTADGGGNLTGIFLNDREFTNWGDLHQHLLGLISTEYPRQENEAEMEIDCDYGLKYEHVIAAITAVSGYKDPGSGEVLSLVETIQFSTRKEGPED